MGNRGSLRSHWGNLRNCIIFEEEVKGEQGLAALAFGKIEEVYKIEGEVIAKNGAIYLTFTGFFVFRVGFAEDPRMGF